MHDAPHRCNPLKSMWHVWYVSIYAGLRAMFIYWTGWHPKSDKIFKFDNEKHFFEIELAQRLDSWNEIDRKYNKVDLSL